MNNKPILIVLGEPNSVFSELLFKVFKNKIGSVIAFFGTIKACRDANSLKPFKAYFECKRNCKDVDDSFRKGEVAWIKDEWLQNMIGSYVGLANGNAGWNFILTTKEDVQFATYTDGGFYNWHRDCDIKQENYRKLSVSVQLSDYDSYEGGDLLLKHVWGNMRLPMDEAIYKQGTIIVFPSMLLHQVTATTKGTRHSLVQWYSGPDFV